MSVRSSSVYPIYQRNLWAGWEQTSYEDDSKLQAVVRKPADRPAVAVSLNRDLARIQEWCNRQCMILNPNKTKTLVVSWSRTVGPPPWCYSQPRLPLREVWQQAYHRRICAWDCFLCLSENWYFEVGETYICGHLCVTSLLFLHLFSQSLSIVLRCGGQLLNVTFNFLSGRCIRWQGFFSIRVSCRYVRRRVADLGLLYKVNSNSNHCRTLITSLSCVFFRFRGAGACGVTKAIYKQLCFSHLGRCCWFY